MSASLVYLLLRQILQMLTQLRPGRRREGRRTAGPPPPGRGLAPPGAPARTPPGRPRGAGGPVAAAAPRALAGVLRQPGHAPALAPQATRPALDLSAYQSRAAA